MPCLGIHLWDIGMKMTLGVWVAVGGIMGTRRMPGTLLGTCKCMHMSLIVRFVM